MNANLFTNQDKHMEYVAAAILLNILVTIGLYFELKDQIEYINGKLVKRITRRKIWAAHEHQQRQEVTENVKKIWKRTDETNNLMLRFLSRNSK